MDFNFLNGFLNSSLNCFSDEEKELFYLIFSSSTEELERLNDNDEFSIDDEAAFKEKREITIENFYEIIHLFEESAKAKKRFYERFPNWSYLRSDNIKKLKEIADSINNDRRNCNISTVTSSVVGILGGAAIIGALALPVLPVVGIAGGIASGIGGATVFGTSVAELALLKKNMTSAKAIKEKDEKDFKLVSDWFKHSQDLIDAFEKIMGFNIAKEIFKSLKNLKVDLEKLRKVKNGKINSKLNTLISMCVKIIRPVLPAMIPAELLFLIPLFISFFCVVVLLNKHNSLIFNSVVISHRVVFGLMKLLDLGADVGMVISNVAMKTAAGATAEGMTKVTARVVAHGVFAGFGIALDVTNAVFASIDLYMGSVSPYANQLSTAAYQLRNEHEVLKVVYSELFPTN